MRGLLLIAGWLVGLGAGVAQAGSVLVAVAANFAEPAARVAEAFGKAEGHEVRLTTGATGKLYAQIKAGAPFEVLLSADAATPARLEAEGAAKPGRRFTYAIGRLALWSPEAGRIGPDPARLLADPGLRHLAIANPALAPYGAAAQQVLTRLGLWDRLSGRLVMGENIGQAHAMVASGAAPLGFVALSALIAPGKPAAGSRWEVPQDLYDPIRQDAVLLAAGEGKPAAEAFFAFLRSPAARAIIRDHGYGGE